MITPDPSSLTAPAPSFPRKPDGKVDWRAVAMQQPAHFYVKDEHKGTVANLLQKPAAEIRNLGPEDLAKVPDKYLVMRKAGSLRLADLRGFVSEVPDVQFALRDYVIVRSLIQWTPFEGMPLTSGGVGEACPENCTELGAAYLAATAENRAFSRNVRDYLQIDIVSHDELGDGVEPEINPSAIATAPGTPAASSTPAPSAGPKDLTPQGTLQRTAEEAHFSFEDVKAAAQSRWDEDSTALAANPAFRRRIENDPSSWTDFRGDNGVPPRDCLTLTDLIRAAVRARSEVRAADAAAAETAPATEPAPPQATAPAAVPKGKRPSTRKVTPISAATSDPSLPAAA